MTENSEHDKATGEEEEVAVEPEIPVPGDIIEALGDAIIEASAGEESIDLTLEASSLRDSVAALSALESGAYNFLASLCGIDHGDQLGLVYHIYRLGTPDRVGIHVRVPRESPNVPSIVDVHPSANWKEREAAEMYGIVFDGHPDPRKLLLPDDWEGFPMRSDYEIPDHPYLRPDPTHELG